MPPLDDLGLGTDALRAPLTYPGVAPPWSALLVDAAVLRLRPGGAGTGAPVRGPRAPSYLDVEVDGSIAALGTGGAEGSGEAPTRDGSPVRGPVATTGGPIATTRPARRSLDEVLTALGVAPLADRTPVLAVGSNASPGQLRAKLRRAGIAPVVPLVRTVVRGVGVAHSAHVSAPGYVPVTPIAAPARRTTLYTVWLDGLQLAAVDATEASNYDRVRLPDAADPRSEDGSILAGVEVYASRRGVLAVPGVAGVMSQPALIETLLARSAALRRLVGERVQDFVRWTSADADRRRTVRQVFAAHGWVRPGLFG